MSGENKAQREKKSRADGFFGAFLMTEHGRPKSSALLYTFCLSFVFFALYLLAYVCVIDWLTPSLKALPVFVGNLIQAISASVLGLMPCLVLHRFLKDKRLVFGGHLWLCLYAIAVLVTMLIMTGGGDDLRVFLVFFGWFVATPILLGTSITYWLFRRDHRQVAEPEPEPEWKRYVNRR